MSLCFICWKAKFSSYWQNFACVKCLGEEHHDHSAAANMELHVLVDGLAHDEGCVMPAYGVSAVIRVIELSGRVVVISQLSEHTAIVEEE